MPHRRTLFSFKPHVFPETSSHCFNSFNSHWSLSEGQTELTHREGSKKILEPEETQHIILPPTPSPKAQLLTNEKSKAQETAICPKPCGKHIIWTGTSQHSRCSINTNNPPNENPICSTGSMQPLPQPVRLHLDKCLLNCLVSGPHYALQNYWGPQRAFVYMGYSQHVSLEIKTG